MKYVLAKDVHGEDAAYVHAQSSRYYLRTGRLLGRMVMRGSWQEIDQALARGAAAMAGRSDAEVVASYNGMMRSLVEGVLRAAGVDP